MNYWICQDFYRFEWLKSFQNWKRKLKGDVFVEFEKLNILPSYEDKEAHYEMQIPKGSGGGRAILARFSDSHAMFDNHVWSFLGLDFSLNPISNYYYYSNRSMPRKDGSYGWK